MKSKKKEHILEERAIKLARFNESKADEKLVNTTVFKIGSQRFALESIYISEVQLLKEILNLPQLPNYMIGIITIRRRVILLVDLKILLEIEDQKSNKYYTIIVREDERELALLVDEIEGNYVLTQAEVQTIPSSISGIKEEIVAGITLDGLIVIDGKKLLNHKAMTVDN